MEPFWWIDPVILDDWGRLTGAGPGSEKRGIRLSNSKVD